jgi:hypothetical protein
MEWRGGNRCVGIREGLEPSRVTSDREICGKRTCLAALGLAIVGFLTAQACTLTRTGDGGIRIEVAPDMVITAYGYEQALSQVNDLIGHCLDGTFRRVCTSEELLELDRIHNRIVRAKGQLHDG